MQTSTLITRNTHPAIRVLLALATALALALARSAAVCVQDAYAAPHKGIYDYHYGNSKTGYYLEAEVLKVKDAKVKFRINQYYHYGEYGYYEVRSKPVTLKLGKKARTFKTRTTNMGDTVKGKIKLVSKKKIKLAVKTTGDFRERMILSTNYKYKTLKWDSDLSPAYPNLKAA